MKNEGMIALAGLAVGLGASWASGQCTPFWDGESNPGTDNRVYAQTMWDPDGAGPQAPVLVIAGQFTRAGKFSVARIATWNGTAWGTLSGGGLDGTVRALGVYNGELIAAGEFTTAGGSPAAGIARYDGSAWHAMGTGLDAPAYAVAAHGSDLYAGGAFVTAGGQSAIGVARWDGSAWHSVGGGTNGVVRALKSYGGSLYMGGEFTMAGPMPASRVAQWDGVSWSALGSGVDYPGSAPVVRALTVSGGKLVVAGQFTVAGPLQTKSIASWDGSAWGQYGAGIGFQLCPACSPGPSMVTSVTDFGGSPAACTDYPAAVLTTWNGFSWQSISSGPNPTATDGLNSVESFGGDLYIGGQFQAVGTGYANNVARRSGSAWSRLGGFDNEIKSINTYNGQLLAAGVFNQAGGQPANRVATWDGTSWAQLGNTTGLGTVYCTAPMGSSLAVGCSTGVEMYDGANWTRLGTVGTADYLLVFNGELYGAANISAPSFFSNAVARWTGSSWVAVGTGVTRAACLTNYNNQLVANITTSSTNFLAKWNGIAWTQLGPNYTGVPGLIAVNGTDLYVAWVSGSTTKVARLNGASWTQLGGDFNSGLSQLAVVNGELYAAGPFSVVGVTAINRLARWDGSAWQPLGGGPSDWVNDIYGFGGRVYIGGRFTSVDGKGIGFLANWGCASAPCYANCDGSTTAPVLNVNDFQCFLNRYAAGDPSANCDGSTTPPVLNVNDFQCFLNAYAAGCP